MYVYSIRVPRLIASSFAALTHRWCHLPHLFLEEPWADLVMAASITEKEPISSPFILVISLSTSPPPPPPPPRLS